MPKHTWQTGGLSTQKTFDVVTTCEYQPGNSFLQPARAFLPIKIHIKHLHINLLSRKTNIGNHVQEGNRPTERLKAIPWKTQMSTIGQISV